MSRSKTQRALKSVFALFLVLAGTIASAEAQEIGDPWLESLRGATGTVIGDLTPRFGDDAETGTAAGTGTPPGAEGTATAADPADQKTAGYIREWIEIAEPPQNVTEGARFHYTYRGNMVGTTADGGIITSAHETGAFDPVFLWQNRRSLDSVNHCTMEDYVVARLAGQPVDHCRGRYKAEPTFDGDRINQAIAACRFKDAKALIEKIGTDKTRQPFRQRYDEAFAHEEQTKALFAKADAAFRNCDFEDAQADLEKAARNTACERYAKQIDTAIAKVTAGAAREQKTKHLFSEADRLFKQGEFATALTRLAGARANTQCKRYISRIDEAIEKVQGEIARADTVAPSPVNPPVTPPQPPPVASGSGINAQPSPFVGIWALSPAACTATGAVPRRSDGKAPGSIAGAIEQGIGEAIEIATKTFAFKFAADGTLHVIKSGGPPVRYGTWNVKGNVLTTFTEIDGDTDTQTILETRPDRIILGSSRGNKQMTMYRCSAAPVANKATGPSAQSGPDQIIGRWSIAQVQGHRIVGMRGYGVETVIDIAPVPGSNPPAYIGTLVRAGPKFETARPGEQIMRFEILPDLTESHKKPFYEVRGRILYTRKIGDWQKLGRAYLDFDKDLNTEVLTGSIVPWIRGEPDQ
ncbi:hypothetical protein [uncultured Roseibium sp.]|uniref:hypothetical protein n=1 Tax=uncultured Roseibium sp. TaxID=1936171 RepID=UPI0032166F5E